MADRRRWLTFHIPMDDQKRYQKNLSCLRKTHPAIYDLVSAFTAEALPRFGSQPGDRVPEVEKALQAGGDFFYFLGMGDGSLLAQCAEAITRENRGVLVIEPSMENLIRNLRARDLRRWFLSGKIFWIAGEAVRASLFQVFDRTLCYAAAHPYFFVLPSEVALDRETELDKMYQWLRVEVIRRKKAMTARLKELPSLLPVNADRPRRIWTFDDFRGKSRFSTIQHVLLRNLFYGLRRLGYETEYIALRDGRYYPPYYRILRMALFKPDLIFLCNTGPAYEMALGAELSRSLKIPKVTWFADDPVYAEHLLLRHKTSPDETYLIADYEWGGPLVENGANPPLYMPGAATRTCRGRKRGSRVCDVVFVGQVRDQRAFFAGLSPAWREYCQRVVMEKLRFPRKDARAAMAQFPMPGSLEPDCMDELRQKVLWEANTRFRLNVVASLADCDLRIYGNEAWLALLAPEIAQRCFRGVLRFKHLGEVYRNARISLNIHSLQSYTCLNVRDFDVPASGGFLLSDWLPHADEVFKPGFIGDLPLGDESAQEVFFYRTIAEMKQLVEYFLRNEDRRQACIERARQRVLLEHTYAHRARFLHELFQRII